MKPKFSFLFFCGVILAVVPLPAAITFGPFGIHGEGGTKNGQDFLIGSGGSVFELDAFVSIAGRDLNGTNQNQKGTSAQLSRDSLPAGLAFTFSQDLSGDQASLVLTYAFSNATSVVFSNVIFFAMLDAEIDQATNTFFNEYGSVKGVAGQGAADGSPDQWQIDEPGFQSGKLFDNLFFSALSNSNSIPQNSSNDVALALGFTLGDLNPGGASELRVMISENGSSLGSLALVQRDSDSDSRTFITLSGGLVPALTGVVFVDSSPTNGVFDSGEGLTNVSVFLLADGVTVASSITDSDGRYNFASGAVPAGSYSVKLEPATLPANVVLVPIAGGATNNPTQKTLSGGSPATLDWVFEKITLPPPVGMVDITDLVQWGLGPWQLNRAMGFLYATLSVTNPASGTPLGPQLQLSLTNSPSLKFPPANIAGTTNGVAYMNLSAASSQLGGGLFVPGGRVTNVVSVFSLTLTPPSRNVFRLWAPAPP